MSENRKEIALGIDIGGTRIKTVALDSFGTVLAENRIDSDARLGPEAVRAAVRKAVQHYIDQKIPFSRIGMGCAGSVDPKTGVVLNSPNFAQWKNVPLRDWTQQDFGVPVNVANDANCAMYTEFRLGNAKGVINGVLLTFGTGIGGGLVLNSRLYEGSTGSAAELGHFSIHADGIPCACGNTGCFERYCSASALEKKLPGNTAKEIFARASEEPFRSTLNGFLKDVKIGITSLANIFDPDVILIGGGLSKGLSDYMDEIQTWVRQKAFPAVGPHVKILTTQYANQSGAIGAALLAMEK